MLYSDGETLDPLVLSVVIQMKASQKIFVMVLYSLEARGDRA